VDLLSEQSSTAQDDDEEAKMDYFPSEPAFSSLSILDLLEARDQFHVHLMHKANVIGTAIGRYLIRKSDSYPSKADGPKSRKKTPSAPRTLENSEVRDYSWPCVLVFVSEWANQSEFGARGKFSPVDFIPKAIYLRKKVIPVCVVLAPLVQTEGPPIDPMKLKYPNMLLSGGYPVHTRVQEMGHVASIGCLVTDGHTAYALTNRHVAGRPNETLSSILNGKPIDIGVSSQKQLGRLPFQEVYKGWPGEDTYVNVDVGLIELKDLRKWSSAIYGVGRLGSLEDLDVNNFTTNLIGCPVRAYGCASGRLFGRIAAFFYRYRSVGGFEYVADFLIGSRTEDPLLTGPGDSGTVWVVETDDPTNDLRPLAIQWGGTVFANDSNNLPFALATNLSTVCRELDVQIVRSSSLPSFEYWGAVGHYTIGSFACEQVEDTNLKKLMRDNKVRISFDPKDINTSLNARFRGFVALADVPDKVWKTSETERTPYGRKGPENPNHYSDMDYVPDGAKSLFQLTPTAASLSPDTWRKYYKSIGWNSSSQRGLLPFRVWQIYKKMVEFVKDGDVESFVAAAGVITHYLGDACQPLHGSMYDDGDPFRKPDGKPSKEFLHHGKAYAKGVHGAYEAAMIDAAVDELLEELPVTLGTGHGMKLIKGERNAGFATIELIKRSAKSIPPMSIVTQYAAILDAGEKKNAAELLWKKFGKNTIKVIADGCNTLAMIWESAWVEGGGKNIPQSKLKRISEKRLRDLYEDQKFLPSVPLAQIDQYL
jgi:hypothetical protein